jgi:hypothetical protein
MSPKSPKSISPAVATTAVDSEPTPPAFPPAKIHPLVNEQAARDIWSVLFALRFVNALVARTFFQPDEYFQSLEPAWRMVFGADSGAWITWVCSPLSLPPACSFTTELMEACRNGTTNSAPRCTQPCSPSSTQQPTL